MCRLSFHEYFIYDFSVIRARNKYLFETIIEIVIVRGKVFL